MQFKQRRVNQTRHCRGKVNEKIMTMDVQIFGKFAGSSYPNRIGKQGAKKWNKQLIEFKENMVEQLKKKQKEKIRGWQKIV